MVNDAWAAGNEYADPNARPPRPPSLVLSWAVCWTIFQAFSSSRRNTEVIALVALAVAGVLGAMLVVKITARLHERATQLGLIET